MSDLTASTEFKNYERNEMQKIDEWTARELALAVINYLGEHADLHVEMDSPLYSDVGVFILDWFEARDAE